MIIRLKLDLQRKMREERHDMNAAAILKEQSHSIQRVDTHQSQIENSLNTNKANANEDLPQPIALREQ
mgnify:FL=1